MTRQEKQELCSAQITLDGEPAVISGTALPYARVTALPDGPSFEFAWGTVRAVVARGGDFRSR